MPQCLEEGVRLRAQILGQIVHDRVDALVRDVFALVTAAVENERFSAEAAQEGVRKRALPHTRRPLDHDGTCGPTRQCRVGVFENSELAGSSYEVVDSRRRCHVSRGREIVRADDAKDRVRIRARAGMGLQERIAQRRELRRRIGRDVGHGRWWGVELLLRRVARAIEKRPPPGERLVHHDADRIEVGRGRRLFGEELLRRHVHERPDDPLARFDQAMSARRGTEVEQFDETAARHEHVGRLHVPMHRASRVQRGKRFDDLKERGAKASRIDAAAGAHVREPISAFHELHREEPRPVLLEQLVEADEVRVREILDGAKFALQGNDRVGFMNAHGLQRQTRIALAIPDLEDEASAALPDTRQDFEATLPERLTRSDCHPIPPNAEYRALVL